MIEYKNIINFILDNDNVTIEELHKRYKRLFTEPKEKEFYGIQLTESGYTITYLNNKCSAKRYETKIEKHITHEETKQ